ncbi:GNAT family N-acetyltransferase [Kiloniella laminariae]|uniref:GNAT family N-acetyltransferase n=1 Tax=Kiloniella laminariae TaxID=454162 RepID=UPI000368D491|nr:GNAT family N-acetyltransferase [Kiloniella laminariae]
MSTCRIMVSEDPAAVSAVAWDAVAQYSLMSSHRWQSFWAAAQAPSLPRSRTAVIAVYDGDHMVGHCGAYRYPYPLPFKQAWQRRAVRSVMWPINPVNFHKPPQVHPEADPDQVLPLLLKGIDQLRLKWLAPAARMVMLDQRRDACLLGHLQQQGYVIAPGITDTQLDLVWSSFQDYLGQGLQGRHRNYLARCYRKAVEAGVELRVIKSPLACQDQIMALLRNVAAQNRSETLYDDSFLKAAEQYLRQDDVIVIGAWVKGQMAACTINYRDGNSMIQKSLGMDYALAQPLNLYRLIMAEGIKYALDSGLNSIRCGFSQYDIKGRLGFEQVDTLTAIKASPSALARLFTYRSGAMQTEGKTLDRSPAGSSSSRARGNLSGKAGPSL